MQEFQREFIRYAIQHRVLRFGQFTLKSGRKSPYFFNTGLFNSGASLYRLGRFYAQALIHAGIKYDVLYGPAYKGIPLVCAAAMMLSQFRQEPAPFAFNRKEAKDHGEGGNLVGAPLKGDVLIVDDVITAGTSVRESVTIIKNAGARPCGVLIALDRQEKGENGIASIEEVKRDYEIPVISIITLSDIIAFLGETGDFLAELERLRQYQERYGLS